MSIIFTLICREYEKVLCEYTDYHGNFEQVTRKLLKKAKKSPKVTISYDDEYLFHFLTEDNITYMCMCEANFPVENIFEYLAVLKDNFLSKYTKESIYSAYAYSFNKEFRPLIQTKMKFYNTNIKPSKEDQLDRLKSGVLKEKTMLLESGDILSQRGEKIQLIVQKADSLRGDSILFFQGAKKVRQKQKRRRVRLIMILIFLLSIAYGIACYLCGGLKLTKCIEK